MIATSLSTLQIGRAFAAVAVVLFHANLTMALPKYFGREVFPLFNEGDSGVHFFFVLSGFVIMFAHAKDIGRPSALGNYIFKRVRRIYPSLWALLVLLLPVYFFVPNLGGAQVDFDVIAAAFAIVPVENESLLAVEWTLRHEVLFYAIFAVAIWKPIIGIIVGSVWVSLSAILPWFGLPYPWAFYFSSYHLLFAFGALAYALYRQYVLHDGWIAVAGGIIFFATWAAIFLGLAQKGDATNLAYGFGAALVILGAALIERNAGGLKIHRSLLLIGDASYAIYLCHYPAVSAACKIMKLVGEKIAVPDVLVSLLSRCLRCSLGCAFTSLSNVPSSASYQLRG